MSHTLASPLPACSLSSPGMTSASALYLLYHLIYRTSSMASAGALYILYHLIPHPSTSVATLRARCQGSGICEHGGYALIAISVEHPYLSARSAVQYVQSSGVRVTFMRTAHKRRCGGGLAADRDNRRLDAILVGHSRHGHWRHPAIILVFSKSHLPCTALPPHISDVPLHFGIF